MRISLCFLLFALLFSSCKEMDLPAPLDEDTLTYLALGDSYTIGESVAISGRFPVQLVEALRVEGYKMADPTIVARTGWTTNELQTGISANNLNETYDLVSLLIGVNNQFRGRSLEEYRIEFSALLDQAINFAGGDINRVFVVSIPDYAFTPYGQTRSNPQMISDEIDLFNTANKEITEAAGVLYVDITPISRQGLSNPGLVAEDGLHPSSDQYAAWVDLMLPEVKQLLE